MPPRARGQEAAAMSIALVPRNARCPFPGKNHLVAITVPGKELWLEQIATDKDGRIRRKELGEFRRWLKQFDTDNDGRISRKELQEAIRRHSAWFAGLRAQFAIRRADRNHNGFVDDSEIEGLIQFAEGELGFKITTDAPAGSVTGSSAL